MPVLPTTPLGTTASHSAPPATTAGPTGAEIEFDRQVDALVQAGVPALLDARDDCFQAMVEPLRDLLPAVGEGSGIPFIVAVPHIPATEVLAAVHTAGGTGRTGLTPEELAGLRPVVNDALPTTPYLVLDVDPGTGNRDVAPADAAATFAATGRSPLTVTEGLAVLVSDCGLRRSGTSFTLLGSRGPNGRLPTLWTSGQRPTLGWWDAATRHPGLGSASCRSRVTA